MAESSRQPTLAPRTNRNEGKPRNPQPMTVHSLPPSSTYTGNPYSRSIA